MPSIRGFDWGNGGRRGVWRRSLLTASPTSTARRNDFSRCLSKASTPEQTAAAGSEWRPVSDAPTPAPSWLARSRSWVGSSAVVALACGRRLGRTVLTVSCQPSLEAPRSERHLVFQRM